MGVLLLVEMNAKDHQLDRKLVICKIAQLTVNGENGVAANALKHVVGEYRKRHGYQGYSLNMMERIATERKPKENTTPEPTKATESDEDVCKNSDFWQKSNDPGAKEIPIKDAKMNGCSFYEKYPEHCGNFDTKEFLANSM